jgi:rhamnose transport system substrate-binding protein
MAFVPKDIVNNYFANSFQGAEEAAGETGGTVQQVGPDTPDAAGQVQFIQTLTQQGVQAIGVSANDPNALAPALQDARAQGIKVVSFDSDVAPDARDLFINQANSEDIGRIQIQIISRLIGCEGQIAVLSAASTATNQNAWIEFMQDELTKPGYENVELVEVVYGDDEPQLSYDKTVELLTAYPDLKGIVSPTTVGIANAAAALEAEGRTDVMLTGLGLPNEMRQYIKNGTVQEMALWNPIDLYYLTYYAGAALVSGEITGAEGDTFTAGRLGEYTVGANGTVLLGLPFIFTADNIDQFDF